MFPYVSFSVLPCEVEDCTAAVTPQDQQESFLALARLSSRVCSPDFVVVWICFGDYHNVLVLLSMFGESAVLGDESNREMVSFRSCVHTRGLAA